MGLSLVGALPHTINTMTGGLIDPRPTLERACDDYGEVTLGADEPQWRDNSRYGNLLAAGGTGAVIKGGRGLGRKFGLLVPHSPTVPEVAGAATDAAHHAARKALAIASTSAMTATDRMLKYGLTGTLWSAGLVGFGGAALNIIGSNALLDTRTMAESGIPVVSNVARWQEPDWTEPPVPTTPATP
jgi:hypothetical protein